MILVAFDPSLSCTGWAVVKSMPREAGTASDAWQNGMLVAAGTITPEGETQDYPARLSSLWSEARALLDEHEPGVVVVELPSKHVPTQGRGKQRTGQPIYGSAVGAVVGAAACPFNARTGLRITPPRMLAFPPDVWTRSLPPGPRMTRDDPHKTRRVMYAASLYGRRVEDFGGKTRGGDVADAILIGRYGLYVYESETERALFKERTYANGIRSKA